MLARSLTRVAFLSILLFALLLGPAIPVASATGQASSLVEPKSGSTTVEAAVSASADDAGLDYSTCAYATTHPQIYCWLIEGSIPVSRTGYTSFSANQSMPFNFGVWDDDLGEVYGQSHMYWRSTSTYSYMSDWGTLTLTDQPWPIPGTIRGFAWHDANRNGARDAGEAGLGGVEIRLLKQQATISTTVTAGTGEYLFSGLMAGKYGVVEQQPGWMPFSTTPDAVPVILPEGGTMTADFGDWRGRPTWLPLILPG